MLDWAKTSLEKIEASRLKRQNQDPPFISEDDGKRLIEEFHPDYAGSERTVKVGPNADTQNFPVELADLLESDSPLPLDFNPQPDIETDVLILGGGGAGVCAALGLEQSGLKVHLATKLRLGDSNTIMAEGGIQAALGSEDSSRRHFSDAYVGGHGNNDPLLLRMLSEQGPASIRWLTHLGVLFDKNSDGTFRLRSGGGTSVPRVLACRDFTGLEIMRVLKDAVLEGQTVFLENHAAVELLDDGKDTITGAVLWNTHAQKLVTVSARATVLATGGTGQLRFQGYPTSNHMGATGDGLVLAYRQGCPLTHLESFQYHPSGTVYPEPLAGQLVTESIRAVGAHLLNAEGNRFVNELSFRDVVAASIIREVIEERGIRTPTGRQGVWLDTPLIENIHGEGTLEKQFPGLIHRFERYNIHPAIFPVLVFPTLHYQNGGIQINTDCQTLRSGLWAAGEVTGGVHGTNRLMGNSLLDIIVFGRRVAESVRSGLPERGKLTLTHLQEFREELKNLPHPPKGISPQLFPVDSGWKFELSKSIEKNSEGISKPMSSSFDSFEPPDFFNMGRSE